MNHNTSIQNEIALSQESTEAGKDFCYSIGDVLLNTYEVASTPYSGGMGSVVRVHHLAWNIDLAMKQPNVQLLKSSSLGLLVNEFESWISLGLHPNIVTCYYVRLINGVPSIFSEWIDDGSLRDKIVSGKLYSGSNAEIYERILDIAIQIARGLSYSHASGLIHQDVKPANILLSSDGTVKVTDFGLANFKKGLYFSITSTSETLLAPTGGYTLLYCSPEQLMGLPLSRRSDIWSWSATILEMFVGKCLWNSGPQIVMLFLILIHRSCTKLGPRPSATPVSTYSTYSITSYVISTAPTRKLVFATTAISTLRHMLTNSIIK